MHPNGQLPAYEFAFSDVNPPVHAWACWRVYKMTGPRGQRDRRVPRARVPQAAAQLHLVGEPQGCRREATSSPAASSGWTTSGCSTARKPLPTGGHLEQADGTAWMAFFCTTMLSIALELAQWTTRPTRTSPQVLRALRGHRRRDEHARRHGAVGRGRRLLLRPAAPRRPEHPAARAPHGGAHPAVRRARCSRTRCRAAARVQQADALVPREPARPRAQHAYIGRRSAGHRAQRLLAIPSRERLVRVLRLRARRERVPVAVRHPSLSPRPRRASLPCSPATARSPRCTTSPGESDQRHLRRKLQLARSGVVPASTTS